MSAQKLHISAFVWQRHTPATFHAGRWGKGGDLVSALGLGGYHLGKIKSQREAIRIVHAAIEAGVTFMDNAWEYHDGRSEIVMGKAIADRRTRVFLMTKLCTH